MTEKRTKIIITGGTGFIGRNLAEGLHNDGYHIVATGRDSKVGRLLQSQGIEFKAANLLSLSQLEEAFSPADCVIHCAAKAGDWGLYNEFHEANVVGTRHVIQGCLRHGIKRVVFISTPSVYVDGTDRFNIRESEPLPPRQLTHYSATKLAAERELFRSTQKGVDVIVFRPRAVYGPHDRNFIPRIARMAERGRFPLIAGGKSRVDVTYIGNFLDIVRAALGAPHEAWNQVYNASNGDPIPISRWFELMLGIVGVPFQPKNVPEIAAWSVAALTELATRLPFGPRQPLTTRFSVRYMARSMTLSTEKAAKMLGYRRCFSTEESFIDYAIKNDRLLSEVPIDQ